MECTKHMPRKLLFLMMMVALIGGGIAPASAQQDIDVAFSDTKLRRLGYP